MNYILITSFLIVIISSSPLQAIKHSNHIKEDQQGEYYEYDLIGDGKTRVLREMRYHSKQIIKAPFKLVGKCYHSTRDALRSAMQSIELFLSDSRSINGRRRDLQNALSQFETEAVIGDFYAHEGERDDAQCMFGVPSGLWRMFKHVLYTAGFRIPRETMHAVKNIFHGE